MIRIQKGYKAENKDFYSNKNDISLLVKKIIDDVKKNGDKALFEQIKKFDNCNLKDLKVSQKEIDEAFNTIDKDLLKILETAGKNINEFHLKQLKEGFEIKKENGGIILGQKVLPIERVGLYVPGGKAAYPSTVLMNAIPAKIAGVSEIAITTPPQKDGKIKPEILVAAKIVGVNEIYKVGGAGAIAALSYGTESIKPVLKITGPGNAFVAEAKKQVFGKVAIDMIAGPSEILIIADKNQNKRFIASDLLSQAEHDENARAILITNDEKFAIAVQNEIEEQLKDFNRVAIARPSIDNKGLIIIVNNINEAIDIANEIAPEHLELCLDEPFKNLDKVKNAGSVFLGPYSPEPLGDYWAGCNHTLPTMGTAKFSSPLSVDDFVKKMQYIYYSKEELGKVATDIETFAKSEGLFGHKNSITVRK